MWISENSPYLLNIDALAHWHLNPKLLSHSSSCHGAGVFFLRGQIFYDSSDDAFFLSLGFHGWCALGAELSKATIGGKAGEGNCQSFLIKWMWSWDCLQFNVKGYPPIDKELQLGKRLVVNCTKAYQTVLGGGPNSDRTKPIFSFSQIVFWQAPVIVFEFDESKPHMIW